MPSKINLLNQKIGKLLILEETKERRNKSVVWKCQCDCGNIVYFSTKQLRSDGIIQCPSCGHNRLPQENLREDIIGKKFNSLTVLEETDKKVAGKKLYKCQCDCGKIRYINRTDLISGHTKSCGCASFKYKVGDIINNKLILSTAGDKTIPGQRHYYKCKCLLCGREYEALTHTLQTTLGCGCQSSIGEFFINQILNKHNIKYQTQFSFDDLPRKKYDFALLDEEEQVIRLIEFDGEQHYKENIKQTGWNNIEHYNKTKQSDLEKNKYAKEHNIPLIRIPYWERYNLSLELLLGNKYLVN